LVELGELYLKGCEIDWNELYQERGCRRISLPTYPFENERYWFNERKKDCKVGFGVVSSVNPLVGINTSDFYEQKFTASFTGDEFFIKDHQISGKKILPGVACLEMVNSAAEISAKRKVLQIIDTTWVSPVDFNSPKDINISLYPDCDIAEYEIWSGDQSNKLIHAYGKVSFEAENKLVMNTDRIRIEEIKKRCIYFKNGDECYRDFRNAGYDYGACFQPIKEIYYSKNEALSELILPYECLSKFNDFELHPTIMDGALQTGLAILKENSSVSEVYVPFTMGCVYIFGQLPKHCYAYIVLTDEKNSIRHYDVYILDAMGNIIVKIYDYSTRQQKSHIINEYDGQLQNNNTIQQLFKKLENGEMELNEVKSLMEGIR